MSVKKHTSFTEMWCLSDSHLSNDPIEDPANSNKILSIVPVESYLGHTVELFEENLSNDDDEHIHAEPYVMNNRHIPIIAVNLGDSHTEMSAPMFSGSIQVI
jgi:hypothetical protein